MKRLPRPAADRWEPSKLGFTGPAGKSRTTYCTADWWKKSRVIRENEMQCDHLQQRLDELLDRRAELRADSDIAAHVADCPTCRRVVGSYEAMLLGLDILAGFEPEERCTARNAPTAGRLRGAVASRPWHLAALATAMVIAVAMAPWWFSWQSSSNGSAAGILPSEQESRPFSGLASMTRDELYAQAMGRAMQVTGRNLAYFPEAVKRVAQHPETDRIVGHIRPLTEPVSTAWEVLLRTWPNSSRNGPEIPESDTSFVRWRAPQYA